jgi:hypothetical protein
MKTTIYIVTILAFSALIISPKLPKVYPPKEVLEEKRSIVFKERKLEHLIEKIEYQVTQDSIKIESIKSR